jgi:predicted PurR-regulated permease PerM
LIILGVLTAIAMMVIPSLVQQATDVWNRLPALFNKLQAFLIERHLLTHRVTFSEAVQRAPGASSDAVGRVFSALVGVAGGIFGTVTTLILTFYLLVDSEAIVASVVRLFPKRRRDNVRQVIAEISRKVSAWLGGQLLLAGLMGSCVAVGLYIMQVPYFYVVALIAAVGETIPMIGPIVAGISAVGVALTVSLKLGIVVGIFFLILHQFEANILVPKVMEKRVGINPVAVIIGLLIGGSVLGVIGAVLAVPTTAILGVMFDEMVGKEEI